jgi:uncharacterized protein
MAHAKSQVPAVEGWFAEGPEGGRLLGSRCACCGSHFFPPGLRSCRNPGCTSDELRPVALSRTGTLWSLTTCHYRPPAPYVAPEPFVPYSIAAVELPAEKLVVLGQLAAGIDPAALRVGEPVELVIETLFEDAEAEYRMWKWRPLTALPAQRG